jgi:hypothetical protein
MKRRSNAKRRAPTIQCIQQAPTMWEWPGCTIACGKGVL